MESINSIDVKHHVPNRFAGLRSHAVARPGQTNVTRTPLAGDPASGSVILRRGAPDVEPAPSPPVKTSHSGPIKKLFDEWGKTNSDQDLDGNGKVGIGDFLQLLGTMSAGPPPDEHLDQAGKVQALFDDWGKTDSVWDLDKDGTVGVKDYLQLLGTMSAEGPADGGPMGMQERLDALIADWGKTDSKYDLDGDGTVGISDFLTMLGRMSGPPEAQASIGDAGSDGPVPEVSDDVADTPRSRLAAMFADYNGGNGNGNAGIRNFLQLMGRMGRVQHADAEGARGPRATPAPGGMIHRLRAAYEQAAAENIARSLLPQMTAAEPDEVRQAIDNSHLPPAQKKVVLDRLAAWHPSGHNLSMVG